MDSIEVITTVRVTKARGITPAQVNEIVQGIRQGNWQAFEENNTFNPSQSDQQQGNDPKKVTVVLEC